MSCPPEEGGPKEDFGFEKTNFGDELEDEIHLA